MVPFLSLILKINLSRILFYEVSLVLISCNHLENINNPKKIPKTSIVNF